MPVKKCNICGKVIKGISKKHAKSQLENHKISHGIGNRFKMDSEIKERVKRTELIRKTAEKILKNNSFGKSTRKLKEKINNKTLKSYTIHQIAAVFSQYEKIKKVTTCHHGNRGSTWILKTEL